MSLSPYFNIHNYHDHYILRKFEIVFFIQNNCLICVFFYHQTSTSTSYSYTASTTVTLLGSCYPSGITTCAASG